MDQALAQYNVLLTIEVRVFWVVVGLYALGLFLHIAHLLAHPFYYAKDRDPKGQLFYGQAAATVLFLTALVQGGLLIFRGYVRGGCPIQTNYEAYQLFAWVATLTYLSVRRRWAHIYMPGLLVNAFALTALLACVGAGKLSPDPRPILPAMQSPWYVWCLGASFFAYGVLAVSFAIVISHLGARVLKACRLFVWENQALVVHPVLQTDGYTLALFAFPILTSAILAGFIWAARSGGQFWSWDYLRTASPLVWVLFGLYLHATHLPRWRGAVAVLFSALGFLGIVLVFVGPRLSVMLGL